MTKEQFLSAMGDIDDKFLKETARTSDEIFEWDPDHEKPQILRPERRPIYPWRRALFTAAAVCILASGIFGVSKLHGIQSAGSSPEISAVSLDISNDPDSIDDKLNSEINKIAKMNSVIISGNEFNAELMPEPDRNVIFTDPVIKTDDNNFAALHISFPNTNENFTLCIEVYRKEYSQKLGRYDSVYVGGIIVTENKESTYIIDYKESVAAGDNLVLVLSTDNDQIGAEGKWLP